LTFRESDDGLDSIIKITIKQYFDLS
jgi:hypothetical protein